MLRFGLHVVDAVTGAFGRPKLRPLVGQLRVLRQIPVKERERGTRDTEERLEYNI